MPTSSSSMARCASARKSSWNRNDERHGQRNHRTDFTGRARPATEPNCAAAWATLPSREDAEFHTSADADRHRRSPSSATRTARTWSAERSTFTATPRPHQSRPARHVEERGTRRRDPAIGPRICPRAEFSAQRAGTGSADRRHRRRDDRARAARAAAQGPDDHRHPDQRPPNWSSSNARGKLERSPSASRTKRICCASSTRSSPPSAAGSTNRQPMVDARLPDGSRVNAAIRPVARRRPAGLDPQILQEAARPARGWSRSARSRQQMAEVLAARRARPHDHDHFGRHRLRQDDDAQRAVGLHLRKTSG